MDNLKNFGEQQSHLQARLNVIVDTLEKQTVVSSTSVSGLLYKEVPYKSGSVMPDLSDFIPFEKDQKWGGRRDSHAWFYVKLNVPKSKHRTELHVETQRNGWDGSNPQFMLYIDGKLRQGLDVNHRSAVLTETGEVGVYLYAYTGTDFDEPLELRISLDEIDEDVEGLYYDLIIPNQLLTVTPLGTDDYNDLIKATNEAVNYLDMRKLGSEDFKASVRNAREYLKTEFYDKLDSPSRGTVSCIGHTHIDLGWLWPVRQTVEKAQRSFATVCALMERFPEYKFMSSQVPLYEMVKAECPELYTRILKRISEGRWEPEGGMYCEADCNLAGGEGLVRQFLYGKKFFMDEFGVDSKILWLPDVFGYSAAMPQILKKFGIDDFVTSKINWNETNTMPHDIFTWKGIDGTEVLTHFLTAQIYTPEKGTYRYVNYNAHTDAFFMKGAYDRLSDKFLIENTLASVGYGDGGGGTTVSDCEQIIREKNGLPGLPTVRWCSLKDYMAEIRATVENNKYLPTWAGELYLEYHRGTYTSQAKNKAGNRKSEFLLQNVETSAVIADNFGIGSFDKAEHDKRWKNVLLNQFHDILPGSSIAEVYEQSVKEYGEIAEYGSNAIKADIDAIASKVGKDGILVYNPNGFEYSGAVEVNGKRVKVENIPAKGYAVVSPASVKGQVSFNGKVLENNYYTVTFDDKMNICSIYDKKENREILKSDNTVRFVAYEDIPRAYDAWEVCSYYTEKSYPVDDVVSVKAITELDRAGVEVTRTFSDSTITDRVWLYADKPLIEFDDDVDWHSKHLLLKREFPIDVLSDKASCEIQFGYVDRPTHENTSWDKAKFEVCAHKYVDVSENNYGVALINESKFGHGLKDCNITLSLLRAPTWPDPDCDMGKHEFKYALLPHASSLSDSDVLREAFFFNNPCFATETSGGTGELPSSFSAVSAENERVVIDTVKPAEDGNGTIVRLYEGKRCRGSEKLIFGIKAEKAYICDMMENELEELVVTDNTVTVSYKPFEIITLKVK